MMPWPWQSLERGFFLDARWIESVGHSIGEMSRDDFTVSGTYVLLLNSRARTGASNAGHAFGPIALCIDAGSGK